MRALKGFALVLAIGLVPLATGGVLLRQHERERSALDHSLEAHADIQSTEIQAGFARGRTIALLTATNPSFSDSTSSPARAASRSRRRVV